MSAKRLCVLMLGVLMVLGSLWGGAYLMEVFPFKHWASFPIFATATMMGVLGFAVIGYAIIEIKEPTP